MWQLTRNRLRDSIDDHPEGKTVREVLDNYQSRGFGVVSDNLLPVVMTFTMTIPDVRDLRLCYPWRCGPPGDSGPLGSLYIGGGGPARVKSTSDDTKTFLMRLNISRLLARGNRILLELFTSFHRNDLSARSRYTELSKWRQRMDLSLKQVCSNDSSTSSSKLLGAFERTCSVETSIQKSNAKHPGYWALPLGYIIQLADLTHSNTLERDS